MDLGSCFKWDFFLSFTEQIVPRSTGWHVHSFDLWIHLRKWAELRFTMKPQPVSMLASFALLLAPGTLLGANESADPATSSDDAKEDKHHHHEHKFIVGIDGAAAWSVYDGSSSSGLGGSLGLRLGSHRPFLGILAYRPEIGGGYARLGGNDTGRVYAGGRFGLNFILGIYAFGHVGVGFGAPDTGFMYDLGGAVDLIVLDIIRPGLHLKYENILNNTESVEIGGHLEFAF
jgi:hypothetical protein